MIDTKFIINASPSRFLNFATISTYHTAFLRTTVLKSKDVGSQVEPGDKLLITVKGALFNASVDANFAAEFAWYGTLGRNWIFHGTHRFQFLPFESSTEMTLFVQTEEFGEFCRLYWKNALIVTR
ncbi:hypothetical protein N7495_007279 [Penicillium taxi]|uniref:uncharacterized protein n=1 Tax=Penicillium taxi TaxID=168475 RepID=UPI00254576BC|nr:uncharacterized protein N7495_007279 [Penicillium taxi]KAJ5895588.1 hypothetical protein N7495_007279 [Penicillium taxi]